MTSLTLPEAKEVILDHFITEWAAATAVDADNEEFTPPVDADWVRIVTRHNDSNQESLGSVGNRKFTRGGSVFIQVFGRLNKGSGSADVLAQNARVIFEGKTIGGIRFTDTIPREIGPDDAWYLINVEAIFEYTETR